MEYLAVLTSIIMINLLLSGDNALVIALASRRLPPEQQRRAVFIGSAGAVALRVLLTLAAVYLLHIPLLQAAGGLLLLWIAVRLVTAGNDAGKDVEAAGDLWGAVRTILVADVVMSIDNVVAIAAVARGNLAMLLLGLGISIPVIIWGSRVIGGVMQRWPLIIVAGGAFLGWTAGEMTVADQAVKGWTEAYPWLRRAVPLFFTALVVVCTLRKGQKIKEPQ